MTGSRADSRQYCSRRLVSFSDHILLQSLPLRPTSIFHWRTRIPADLHCPLGTSPFDPQHSRRRS